MSKQSQTEPGQYRVGIVGLSWITSDPARAGTHPALGSAPPHSHISSLAEIPSVQVVAGCDIVPEARDRFVDTWSHKWPGVNVYDDYRTMIDAEGLDILCVATPDHLHGDVVRYAAEQKVRGIFCEKPISVSLEDADSMIESIENHQVTVNINNTRRWVPIYVAAREAIRSGTIGTLQQINIHFGGERAILWRNHSHFLDLFSYFAESTPEWVVGELESSHDDYGLIYKGDGGRTADLEPGVNAYIAYQNGIRGFLSGMKAGAAQLSVQLIGSSGRIDLDDKFGQIVHTTDLGTSRTPLVAESTMQSMHAGIVDLIHAMETGAEPQSPPSEARKTVLLIEGILESHKRGNSRIDLTVPVAQGAR